MAQDLTVSVCCCFCRAGLWLLLLPSSSASSPCSVWWLPAVFLLSAMCAGLGSIHLHHEVWHERGRGFGCFQCTLEAESSEALGFLAQPVRSQWPASTADPAWAAAQPGLPLPQAAGARFAAPFQCEVSLLCAYLTASRAKTN